MKLAPLVACLGFAACSIAAVQPQQQLGTSLSTPIIRPSGTARGATAQEIAAAFIGNTVDFAGGGVATYGVDGSYTYRLVTPYDNEKSTGRYSIRPSTICIYFDDGFSRCDTIYVDNGKYTLVNKENKEFGLSVR
jgi:hypothetical protein